MAIPNYQSLMLPVLKLASDGKEHKFRSAVETSADELGFGAYQTSLTPLTHEAPQDPKSEGRVVPLSAS